MEISPEPVITVDKKRDGDSMSSRKHGSIRESPVALYGCRDDQSSPILLYKLEEIVACAGLEGLQGVNALMDGRIKVSQSTASSTELRVKISEKVNGQKSHRGDPAHISCARPKRSLQQRRAMSHCGFRNKELYYPRKALRALGQWPIYHYNN